MGIRAFFLNQRCDDGYEWQEDRRDGDLEILGQVMPKLRLIERSDRRTPVNPLERTALFRHFAALSPTPDDVRAFADQYGAFGPARFRDVEQHIWQLNFLIGIWDAVVSRNKVRLSRHFKEVDGRSFLGPLTQRQYHFPVRDLSDGFPADRPTLKGTILQAAQDYVVQAVNNSMTPLSISVQLMNSETTPVLGIQPTHLLGAIWMQFATSIATNQVFRNCETCGTAFEIDPDVNRTSRQYCDDACRVKAYRHRKSQARLLHARGKTASQIATALNSDTQTVKQWLKAKR